MPKKVRAPATATIPFDPSPHTNPAPATSEGPAERARKIKEAQVFLRTLFADGRTRPAAEVEALVAGTIARSTLALARERERITTKRIGQQWIWTPPKRRAKSQPKER